MDERISTPATIWRWDGSANGSWHFARISGAAAASLSATALMRRAEGVGRGFGSLRVAARIGESRWQTSVFPHKNDSGEREWLLPVKAAVRRAEGLAEGDAIQLALRF